jgi:N-acetylglutamate kinase (EC 2.7.2.8)
MTTSTPESAEAMLSRARIISEALPYMQRYDDKTIVVKYGGHAMGDPGLARAFARDIVLLKQSGMKPIVVHGGGPQIGSMLDKLGIKSEFKNGLRVTDRATMEIVEMVLAGSINKQIVSALNAEGGRPSAFAARTATLSPSRRRRAPCATPTARWKR